MDVSTVSLNGAAILANYPNDFNGWMFQIISNFKASEITNPVQGMLWYNTSEDRLKLYNSVETWKNLATEEFVNNKAYAPISYMQSYVAGLDYVDNTSLTAKDYATKTELTDGLNLKLDKTATATNSAKLGGKVLGNVVNGVPYFSIDGHLVLPSGAEIW